MPGKSQSKKKERKKERKKGGNCHTSSQCNIYNKREISAIKHKNSCSNSGLSSKTTTCHNLSKPRVSVYVAIKWVSEKVSTGFCYQIETTVVEMDEITLGSGGEY